MDDRFTRQIPLIGFTGQHRLAAARILVIGAGGLGCPTITALAAAGIGHLSIVDPDTVESSNLHRQTLYGPGDVGQAKVDLAHARLTSQFPDLTVDAVQAPFCPDHIAGHDLVVEGTDRLSVRYAASDACQAGRVPLITGAVEQWHGQAAYLAPGGPCYRCLWPEPGTAPSCAEAGVLASQTGLVGSWLAQVALRTLIGKSRPSSTLWTWDGANGSMDSVTIPRRPGCRCASTKPQTSEESGTRVLPETTPMDLRAAMAHPDRPFVLDVREEDERATTHIEGDDAHIPMMQVPERVREVPKDRKVVVYCAAGARSAQVTAFLRQQGVDAVNLHGGMYGWQATQ